VIEMYLLGGGALTTAGAVIWALVERGRAKDRALGEQAQRNRAEKAELRITVVETSADKERAQWQARNSELERMLAAGETIAASRKARIAELEKELHDVAANDPALAGRLLLGVLRKHATPDDPVASPDHTDL
jgi:hypothetical protein